MGSNKLIMSRTIEDDALEQLDQLDDVVNDTDMTNEILANDTVTIESDTNETKNQITIDQKSKKMNHLPI